MDVDGVLTDGKIVIDGQGKELKNFDVQDGFGIVVFQKVGYKTAIISARSADAVTARVTDLKIHKVFQDAFPKIKAYEQLLSEFNVRDEEVCFVGDDWPDLGVLSRVGFAVAVANAVSEVKKTAHYVTKKKGGDGAVREIIDLILKTQGKWKNILSGF